MNTGKRVGTLALATILISCAGTGPTGGDETTVVIRGENGCAPCSIEAESVAFLPHPDDTLALVPSVAPARDSRGRYYAVDGTSRREVHVFDGSGRRTQTFGKPGRGPGEFSNIADLEVGREDSLFVFESRRVLVFSPDYVYVREFPFQEFSAARPSGMLTLSDGRFLMASAPNRFSILSPDGSMDSVSARAGAELAAMRASRGATPMSLSSIPMGIRLEGADTTICMQCGLRSFGEGADAGTIWSASMHQYVVEQHDLSGKLLRRVVREAAWYPKWPAEEVAADMHGGMAMEMSINNEFMLKESRKSRVVGMYEAGGLLWTQSTTQDPENPIPPDTDFMKELMASGSSLDRHFVTVVEALDVGKGELVAARHLPGMVRPLGGDLVVQVLPDEDGVRSFRILRLRLVR